MDGFKQAADNMAVDEAMLLCHRRGLVPPTLRFYGWCPPAVSIGYSQRLREEVDLEACRRLGIGWVRRPTGGRAVLHDQEVTYSVVISQELLPGSVLETYRWLAGGLLAGLRELGIRAEMAEGNRGKALSGACFDAPSSCEVVVGGRKLVGSAQTRQQGTILQHGSILIRFDPGKLASVLRLEAGAGERVAAALEKKVTSLEELGRPVGFEEVARAVAEGFRKELGIELQPDGLSREEEELAAELEGKKYRHEGWNHRR